jgi:anti-sigma factor RsiW
MTECTNLEMQDRLPEYARGALQRSAREAVEQHLASCAACRAELEVVRGAQTLLMTPPALDLARIAEGVRRATRKPNNSVVPIATRRRGRPSRGMLLAAASIAAVAAASVLTLMRAPRDPGSASPAVQVAQSDSTPSVPEAAVSPAPRAAPREAELSFGGGVADLADSELEALLDDLESSELMISAEPVPMLPLLEGDV